MLSPGVNSGFTSQPVLVIIIGRVIYIKVAIFWLPTRRDYYMDIMNVLKRCEVFVGLDDNDLEKIANLPSWHRDSYDVGDFVFRENAEVNDFHILENGEVRLCVALPKEGSDEPMQIPVGNITTGDILGWSALVSPHFLTTSAVCVKPSSVIAVNRKELTGLMDCNQSLGYEVMKGLVRVIGARLRDLRLMFVSKFRLM